MPGSVFPKLCAAAIAAGVLTAFPEDEGLVCGDPKLFPDVPWLRAFEVLDPGAPPVPLMVLPFETVDLRAPVAGLELLAPADTPPVLCDSERE